MKSELRYLTSEQLILGIVGRGSPRLGADAIECPGWDLNPHGGCPPKDFKSLILTSKPLEIRCLQITNVKVCK